ncbi:MAG: PA domain-containing protein, partial [Bacteroidota bacterium]
MPRLLHSLVLALVIAPHLALAQNAVLEIAGTEYPAQATEEFGAQFENLIPFGPYDVVIAEDEEGDGTTLDGCDPITNPNEVAGKVAFISRGTCAFVTKAQNAASAGAVAYIVYGDERGGTKDPLINMGGDCTEDGAPPEGGCSVPGAFITQGTYLQLIADIRDGAPATITPSFPLVPSTDSVETGVVNLPIYDNGFFGANEFLGSSFGEVPYTYNGFTPLLVGTVLVGIGGNVAGSPYLGVSEYESDEDVVTGTFGDNRPAAQARFRSDELGVAVTNLTFGVKDDPIVALGISAASTTGTPIDSVYLGLFVNWDVSDDDNHSGKNDLGGFDEDLKVAYVYDADQAQ